VILQFSINFTASWIDESDTKNHSRGSTFPPTGIVL